MEHTKTPWKVENDYEIKESGGLYVATAHHSRLINSEEQKANARRICAAVNATANLKIEVLETIDHPGGHSLLDGASWKNEALTHAKLNNQAWDKVEQLQAENARLLEALKYSLEALTVVTSFGATKPIIAKVSAAIAEAETKEPQYGSGDICNRAKRGGGDCEFPQCECYKPKITHHITAT